MAAEHRETALVVIGDSGEAGCEPVGGVVWGGQGGRDWTAGTRTDGLQAGWVHMHMGCYPDPTAFWFLDALAHEMGHALGVPHLDAPGDLMNPGGGPRVLSSDDIAAYLTANPKETP